MAVVRGTFFSKLYALALTRPLSTASRMIAAISRSASGSMSAVEYGDAGIARGVLAGEGEETRSCNS